MSIKLKTITNDSWLVINDTETNIGLLTQMKETFILTAQGEKKKFLNKKEVNGYFSQNIFDNIIESDDPEKKTFIKGYPTKVEEPCEIWMAGNNLPLYSKKKNSKSYYAAGYYCIEFDKMPKWSFCPKLETLNLYKYSGPFKTEQEAKLELSKLLKLKRQ